MGSHSPSREVETVGVTQAIPKNAKTDSRTINHHKEGKQMLGISLFTRQLALGAVFAAGLALSSASAGAGSAPVTVINPSTDPVKTRNVDEPGRNPYQFFKNLQPCVNTTCQVTTPAVPEGKRLVVQHVSAFGALTSPGNTVEVVVSSKVAVLSTFAPPVFGTTNQGFAFDQPVLGYVDAGDTVTFFISTNGSFNQAASDFVITGYLVDCPADACAPIAP